MSIDRLHKSSQALTARMEPLLEAAFKRAVKEAASGVDMKALTRAIENKDEDAAFEALNLDGAFEVVLKQYRDIFEASGRLTANLVSQEAAKQGVGK